MREARFGWIARWQSVLAVPVVALSLMVAVRRPVFAIMKYGPLQLSGNVETQNLIRDPSPTEFQFIQNRNTVRLRLDWDWLQNGKLIDKFDIPFIERSKVFVLYRGVYDGFYDLAPTDNQIGQTRFDDLVGGPISGHDLGQLNAQGKLQPGRYSRLTDSARTSDKFEDTLREAYIDLKLASLPVSFRLGRQQVIWGESDQFRLMDIWNPLDTTWHFQQESWDNIRVPLWLGKGLWDIGELGPLSNTFLEVVYNPFDFQPGGKVDFLPQPWGLPFPDPLRSGQINTVSNSRLAVPVFDLEGTSYRHGDFHRNPQDASEVGARFHAVTPQGLEFSMDYLYGRGRGVGAASPFGVKIESVNFPKPLNSGTPIGKYQLDINDPSRALDVVPVNVRAKVVYPYMHIFGLTGNYFEGDYTATVFRFETAYAMGEPFQTVDPNTLVPVTQTQSNGHVTPFTGTSPLGFTKRDIWAGMIGFDRPTWIRFLNSKATWFLTGQVFWNYTTGGHVDQLRGNSGAGETPYFGPTGVWVTGPFAGQVERQQAAIPGNGDDIRRWEHLVTLGATSFYRGGTVVPFIADAWDPVNDNDEVLWNVDFFYTNDLIFTVQQKFFFQYGSKFPSDDPWFAGGRFDRRDETGVKVTYQF